MTDPDNSWYRDTTDSEVEEKDADELASRPPNYWELKTLEETYQVEDTDQSTDGEAEAERDTEADAEDDTEQDADADAEADVLLFYPFVVTEQNDNGWNGPGDPSSDSDSGSDPDSDSDSDSDTETDTDSNDYVDPDERDYEDGPGSEHQRDEDRQTRYLRSQRELRERQQDMGLDRAANESDGESPSDGEQDLFEESDSVSE